MAKIKNKADLIAAIAKEAEITKKQADTAYSTVVDAVYKGAKAKEGFTLPGLGKFVKKKQKARMGYNPAKGKKMKIKAKTVVKFRVAKAAQDNIVGAKKKK